MRLTQAALLGCVWAAFAGPGAPAAWAQVASGYEVQVNPVAVGGGVLLYPGGEYARVVPQLKQPGDTGRPISLHMPVKRPRVAAAPRPAPDEAEAAPAPVRRPARVASAPAPAASAPSIPGYVPLNSAASLFGGAPTPVAPAQPAPRTQVARAEPAPSQTPTPGMAKRSMILFAAGAPDPSRDSLSAIKFLAGDLNAALAGDAGARIQLQAFGGDKGDKGSDARRLSLKRALAIRQVLIDDGVSADRINVSAMGGADDGPPDRVDVYLKS
jgi:outer membrane protein OmpA-like peptidoglycan-associated protein